jgi:uncharacterized protein (TIGR03435 family)
MRPVFLTLTAAAAAAFAQAPPAFDVASIRVTAPGNREGGGMKRDMKTGALVTISPDSVSIRNSTLRSITCWAYHVFDYQIKGPDWIGGERYDVMAKTAQPVAEEQLRRMMQTLLADRFKMVTHPESKEMQAYLLQIAKGGIKVKESTSGEGDMDVEPNQQKMQVTVRRAGISQLIDVLGNVFRAPIVDQTGLKGKYDATFDMMKYMAEMRPTDGGAPPDPQAIVIRGLQEELGLKLEPKKMAVDLVVIDKAEKVPAEN